MKIFDLQNMTDQSESSSARDLCTVIHRFDWTDTDSIIRLQWPDHKYNGKLNSVLCVQCSLLNSFQAGSEDTTVLMVKLLANLCVGLISCTNPSLPVWTMCCSRCVSRDQIRIKKHDNIRHILYYWPPLHVRLISRAFQAVCVMESLCWIS